MKTEIEIEEPLLNGRELSAALRCSFNYLRAMKMAGFVFSHGKRSTLSAARAWLAAHPEFRSTKYLAPKGNELAKVV